MGRRLTATGRPLLDVRRTVKANRQASENLQKFIARHCDDWASFLGQRIAFGSLKFVDDFNYLGRCHCILPLHAYRTDPMTAEFHAASELVA